MKKRTKIREYSGWRCKHIDYTVEGFSTTFITDDKEWRKYEIMLQLTEKYPDLDEKLLEEIYEIGYYAGRDDGYESGYSEADGDMSGY